jgi:hypothetical protein
LETKINDLIIKNAENINNLKYFAPQIIIPEKTADFFLLHRNHLIKAKDFKILLLPDVSGACELLEKVDQSLQSLAKRAEYGWNDLAGNFLKWLYPQIQDIIKQVSITGKSEEEAIVKISLLLNEKMRKQSNLVLDLLANLSLPFIQLLQVSLSGYISKYIVDNFKKLVEAYGLSLQPDSFKIASDIAFTLYTSKIVFPILFTRVCTNPIEPHYDFVFTNMPLVEDKCRVCQREAITFGLYLITEPYSSFKERQKDLCYVISSYLSNKSAGELICYPDVYIKKGLSEEQTDIFIKNWTTGELAVVECKVKENPKATSITKVNIVRQDITQLIRKMNLIGSDFGYLITNIQFESDDERKKVLEDATKELKDDLPNNIKLLGKIQGKETISEWNTILTDLKRK